jgi:hypothetical protein
MKNAPAAPQLSPSVIVASGAPCAMPLRVNASISGLPFASFHTRRACLPIDSFSQPRRAASGGYASASRLL